MTVLSSSAYFDVDSMLNSDRTLAVEASDKAQIRTDAMIGADRYRHSLVKS
jgi:hypothetical protein